MMKSSEFSSTSVPVNKISVGVSSTTVLDCGSAIGTSLTEATEMLTSASSESTKPSLTRKLKLSLPLKFSTGVYVRVGAVPESVPCEGLAVTM